MVRLERIFREVLEDDTLELKAGDSQETLEGWDSFAQVKLIIGLEEEFGIKFTMDEVEYTKNVEGLAKLVEGKLGA